ncbi:Nif3-like dinuclear metal center hexameric protein [Kurthia sibirica]|uniref:GTP cyclohydrolase 1 type 2 homolog n=1 Tax=Kurthia sibirica TaxID=202750 RepID=A0A2U3AM17_9BACL|nr:Nif3-like dinuclear metal center hexameric protein [Kurthia sibirica]PWI25575.1 Nif3-like dinuclear metal center hexameric protein [Kurthia sibirica]GEK35358.1 GTP cyclohydrolase 1 type 2 [Kurthia sibirica]
MKPTNGQAIIQLFETWSPKKLMAMEQDPIGLAIGTLNKAVTKVLVTLDVTDEVVDEAIAAGCELIIAHHPPIFRKLAHIRTDTPQGKLYEKLIKNDLAVYAAHTNLDVAEGGVNDLLAEALQLQNIGILTPTYTEQLFKLAVYIPREHALKLRVALAQIGAGQMGAYDSCSFQTSGEGRFRALDHAQPFVGTVGDIHMEPEEKVEVVIPQPLINKALRMMKQNHPYEEVAYDLYALATPAKQYGIGRIGLLAEPMTLAQFGAHVKKAFHVPTVRAVGDLHAIVRKVAVLGGSGDSYVSKAKYAGADVFVTGDISFHIAQDAEATGLSLIDPGHHIEAIMKQGVANKMTVLCTEHKMAVEFIPSNLSTEPFKFI